MGAMATREELVRGLIEYYCGLACRPYLSAFIETVVEGLEATPDAFLGLFSGANTGKMLVRV